MNLKVKKYRGYTFKHCKFGWFGVPDYQNPDADRWGNTPTLKTRAEVEVWIDNLIDG